jgi:AraC-like DNA-binding protein/mannose-6-phosphate isomerase-like protein (cupin superfamily)
LEEKNFNSSKRGYLNNDFEFFHLKDKRNEEFEFHYHDFNKIIIFISGDVTYLIEGKAYKLMPWDILFVSSNEIHRPTINPVETYERIVIWINSKFLEKHSGDDCNLLSCFELSSSEKRNLLRLDPEMTRNVKYNLSQLEDACKDNGFGSRVLKNSLFIQLIVQMNRLFLGSRGIRSSEGMENDEAIDEILDYINCNLENDLSIENLSSRFYMSKYYLMHRFKSQTGYTIHSYIMQKRLIAANQLIKGGKPITQACIECGFGDYSSFVRAFKKIYGLSPRNHYKMIMESDEA